MIFTEDECPLCEGEKMRINRDDFFECPKCHAQITIVPGCYAIVLRWKGKGEFRTPPYDEGNISGLALTRSFGDSIAPDEVGFFGSMSEIVDYLNEPEVPV